MCPARVWQRNNVRTKDVHTGMDLGAGEMLTLDGSFRFWTGERIRGVSLSESCVFL
jgi:hypothetical protein